MLNTDTNPSTPAPVSAVNTRTEAGRADLDAAILKALKRSKQPSAAADLMKATGATALQVRASLRRLAEAGKVSASGNTRATRYSLALAS